MMPAVLAGPPVVADPGSEIPARDAENGVGATGTEDLLCPASWPRKPIWAKTTARNTASATCHHEFPMAANAAQPTASAAVVSVIFQA